MSAADRPLASQADPPPVDPALGDELRAEDPISQPPTRRVPGRFNLANRSLREHAARGTMINAAFTVALSGVAFSRAFVVAAFLTPADYGVWGLLAVSIGTLLWLKQVGIGDKYIEQDDEDQEAAFQKAFTLELALTGVTTLVLAALLPLFALIYDEWQIVAPGLVVLLALPAGILQTPLWVYYRRMQFVRQRALQAIDPIVGTVVAVGLAAAGAGYWALIIGLVAGAWTMSLACLVKMPFRLRLRWERQTLRSYAAFSWPLFVAAGGSVVIAQAAVFAADAQLGLAAVGAVALANSITQFTARLDYLITGTLYPAICAVKDRVDLLEESFAKSNRLALLWGIPFGIALALFSGDLVEFGLGEKWNSAVVLLQVTGVVAAISQIGFNWDAYFRARAETRPMAVASIVSMVTFLAVGLPLLFLYDLRGLAIGLAATALAHLACRAYYLQRLFEGLVFIRHALRSVLPTIPAVAAVFTLRLLETGERTLALALAELVGYIVVTALATWAFERDLLREAAGYLRRRDTPEVT